MIRRCVLPLAILGVLCSLSRGDDNADRSRRVRVALALSCGCSEHCDPKLAHQPIVRLDWYIGDKVEIAPAPKVAKEKKDKAEPPPPVTVPLVMPRIGVETIGEQIRVYGWDRTGTRVGYVLPKNATEAQIEATKKQLESWLDCQGPT